MHTDFDILHTVLSDYLGREYLIHFKHHRLLKIVNERKTSRNQNLSFSKSWTHYHCWQISFNGPGKQKDKGQERNLEKQSQKKSKFSAMRVHQIKNILKFCALSCEIYLTGKKIALLIHVPLLSPPGEGGGAYIFQALLRGT